MKLKSVLLLFFMANLTFCFAQKSEDFYAGELSKMVNIPNSPEAEAFTKYGDNQVSLYSGIPQVNLPLYTIKGRELDLPIGLTYDASGIKVEQVSTDVGLGWNLNVGGRISRIINGLADDYLVSSGGYLTINTYNQINSTYPVIDNINNAIAYDNGNGGYFPTLIAAQDYFTFLDDLISNRADAEPDYYSLNAPGISGTMVLDISDFNKPKVLNNPRIKVTKIPSGTLNSIGGWIVVNEDGTKYYFETSETTKRAVDFSLQNFGNITSEYTSSWVLTKIVSKNGKDIYEFNYTPTGYWKQEQQSSSSESSSIKILTSVDTYPYAAGTRGVTNFQINQQILNSVVHNLDTVITVDRGVRYDIKDENNVVLNNRLTGLNFLDLIGNEIRSVDLDNDDYFNLNGGVASQKNPLEIRLKLNGFAIKGSDNSTYQTYAFEYEQPDNVPPRDSYAQDYFGYYNGANNNSTLIPQHTDGTNTFDGGNREPDTEYAKIGLLKKMIYPTKGYSEFEFEGHEEYKTETVDNTETILATSLPGSGVTHDAALYTNENNNSCLDHLDNPLIKMSNFIIPEEGFYKITYTGNPYAEVGIIYTGPEGGHDTYCNFFGTSKYSSTLSGTNESIVHFNAGKHKAMLVLGESINGTYSQPTSLTVNREVQNVVAGNYPIGGLRIKEMRNYSALNVLATTKAYNYRDSLDRSTGRINYKPNLWARKIEGGPDYYLIRKAAYAKGNASYVVYKSVKELQKDANGNTLGYIEHTFYDENKGITPRSSTPFENNYYPSLKGGELQQKIVVDSNGDALSKQGVEYFETSTEAGFSNRGWVAFSTEQTVAQTLYIRGYHVGQPNEFYSYEYKDSWTGCESGGYSPILGTTLCAVPLYVSNTSSLCDGIPNCSITLMADKYAAIRGRFSFASTVYGGVSAVRDTVYLKNPSNAVVAVSTSQLTEYESAIDYLPRKSTNIDSKGIEWETTHYYPKDNLVAGALDLVTRNNLTAQMKTVTIKEPNSINEQVSDQEVEYLYISSNVVLPKKITSSKGSNTLQELGEFTYYANGNLKTSKKANGPETVYIWGYEDRYPIAKIENATYAEVSSQVSTLQNLSNLDASVATENTLRSALENLRNSVSEAQVTTYTYDPLIGATSMTDSRGYTIYYKYDVFNRLEEVRDKDNNIVTDYGYHYKGQAN